MKKQPQTFYIINSRRIKVETFPELTIAFTWKGLTMFTHPAVQIRQKMPKNEYYGCKLPIDVWILINTIINKSRFATIKNHTRNIGSNQIQMMVEEVKLLNITVDNESFLFQECADIYEKYKDDSLLFEKRDTEIYE